VWWAWRFSFGPRPSPTKPLVQGSHANGRAGFALYVTAQKAMAQPDRLVMGGQSRGFDAKCEA
jgi:hypothetical protein